ncbi:hypothetical protein P0Y35_16105 [Kiritimatiellaeota bacterium B1221]|nr:hypothetical protein [Kiritimatiellaeota bacterium B1221]
MSFGTEGTTFKILDSQKLNQSGSISLTADDLSDLSTDMQTATNSDLVHGQVFDLTGLDGILQVLEMNYDQNTLGFSENGVRIGWYNPDENEWMLSVMGNSDVSGMTESIYSDGKFFSGSYLSYLESIGNIDPTLGAHGVDTENNVAWAVVDHNSSFAVIPEVNSLALMAIAFLAFVSGKFVWKRKS